MPSASEHRSGTFITIKPFFGRHTFERLISTSVCARSVDRVNAWPPFANRAKLMASYVWKCSFIEAYIHDTVWLLTPGHRRRAGVPVVVKRLLRVRPSSDGEEDRQEYG